MGIKQFKQQNGFTLVELIAVVAIISMIAVYITIEINQSSDDAKIGLATAFLTSNVPSAISSYRARHLSSCVTMVNPENNGDDLDGDGVVTVKDLLMARGLARTTPWADEWEATFDNATREITLVFPLTGTNAGDVAAALTSNLENRSQIVSIDNGLDENATSGDITIVYSCS